MNPRGAFAGLSTIDLTYHVAAMPPPNAKLVADEQELSAGGPAANAAVAFAYLGGQARLITGVGQHPVTAIIRDDLSRFRVALEDLAPTASEAPPLSSIFAIGNTGARSIVSASRALRSLDYAAFRPAVLDDCTFLLVDGHYMPLAIAAASAARARGMRVILDGGSWKDGLPDLLPLVDTAICSADFRVPGYEGEDAVADFLRGCGISEVAITRGHSAIRFWCPSAAGEVAVPQVDAADTSGAGDIFHGAFCFYACEPGATFQDALAKAAVVASESCRHIGTRAWMRHWGKPAGAA